MRHILIYFCFALLLGICGTLFILGVLEVLVSPASMEDTLLIQLWRFGRHTEAKLSYYSSAVYSIVFF